MNFAYLDFSESEVENICLAHQRFSENLIDIPGWNAPDTTENCFEIVLLLTRLVLHQYYERVRSKLLNQKSGVLEIRAQNEVVATLLLEKSSELSVDSVTTDSMGIRASQVTLSRGLSTKLELEERVLCGSSGECRVFSVFCLGDGGSLERLMRFLPYFHFLLKDIGFLNDSEPFPSDMKEICRVVDKHLANGADVNATRAIYDWLDSLGEFTELSKWKNAVAQKKENEYQETIRRTAALAIADNSMQQISALHGEIESNTNLIKEHYRDIAELTESLRLAEDRMRRIALGESDRKEREEDLIRYLQAMRDVMTLIPMDDGSILIVIRAPILVDDETVDSVVSMIGHEGSIWRAWAVNSPRIAAMIRGVFIKRTVKLWARSYWLVTANGVACHKGIPSKGKNIYADCSCNAHMVHYGCLGTAASAFESCNQNHEIVGALQIALSCTRSFNVTDSIVAKTWIKRFSQEEEQVPCFEFADGTRGTIRDVCKMSLNKIN